MIERCVTWRQSSAVSLYRMLAEVESTQIKCIKTDIAQPKQATNMGKRIQKHKYLIHKSLQLIVQVTSTDYI